MSQSWSRKQKQRTEITQQTINMLGSFWPRRSKEPWICPQKYTNAVLSCAPAEVIFLTRINSNATRHWIRAKSRNKYTLQRSNERKPWLHSYSTSTSKPLSEKHSNMTHQQQQHKRKQKRTRDGTRVARQILYVLKRWFSSRGVGRTSTPRGTGLWWWPPIDSHRNGCTCKSEDVWFDCAPERCPCFCNCCTSRNPLQYTRRILRNHAKWTWNCFSGWNQDFTKCNVCMRTRLFISLQRSLASEIARIIKLFN